MQSKAAALLLLTPILALPAEARDPANPDAFIPPVRYGPLLSGTRSYRPVEPLPWGQVNRRVMPKEVQPVPRDGKAEPGPQTPTQRTQ